MKKCTIRVKATGQVLTVKSYSTGWVTSKGEFIHRTAADLISVNAD